MNEKILRMKELAEVLSEQGVPIIRKIGRL